MGRQGAERDVIISRGKKKKKRFKMAVSHQNERFSQHCYQLQGETMFCTQEFHTLGFELCCKFVQQCSVLRNSTFWFHFVVNLSQLSFFSSKVTLKTLRKEASLCLIQNILSSNSSAEKNSGKTPNRLL